jgi:hypothetical protein
MRFQIDQPSRPRDRRVIGRRQLQGASCGAIRATRIRSF